MQSRCSGQFYVADTSKGDSIVDAIKQLKTILRGGYQQRRVDNTIMMLRRILRDGYEQTRLDNAIKKLGTTLCGG